MKGRLVNAALLHQFGDDATLALTSLPGDREISSRWEQLLDALPKILQFIRATDKARQAILQEGTVISQGYAQSFFALSLPILSMIACLVSLLRLLRIHCQNTGTVSEITTQTGLLFWHLSLQIAMKPLKTDCPICFDDLIDLSL